MWLHTSWSLRSQFYNFDHKLQRPFCQVLVTRGKHTVLYLPWLPPARVCDQTPPALQSSKTPHDMPVSSSMVHLGQNRSTDDLNLCWSELVPLPNRTIERQYQSKLARSNTLRIEISSDCVLFSTQEKLKNQPWWRQRFVKTKFESSGTPFELIDESSQSVYDSPLA